MTAPARLSGLAGEALELHYVDLDAASLWDRNPKRHDLGAIAASIRRYGFKDPPKWEPAIGGEGVAGGFVEGNGRTEVLRQMRDAGEEVPRGILLHGKGKRQRWAMPVLFGIDSASRAEAEAYAIDHNNLVVGGGDTSLGDMVRLWDRDALMLVLLSAAAEEQAPVSIDASDIEALLAGPPPGSEGITPSGGEEVSPLELVASTGVHTEAVAAIADERRRQVAAEGYDDQHDDQHVNGELAAEAGLLALDGLDDFELTIEPGCGWGLAAKHRTDRRRQLVIAGALLVAEMERLDRLVAHPKEERCSSSSD